VEGVTLFHAASCMACNNPRMARVGRQTGTKRQARAKRQTKPNGKYYVQLTHIFTMIYAVLVVQWMLMISSL